MYTVKRNNKQSDTRVAIETLHRTKKGVATEMSVQYDRDPNASNPVFFLHRLLSHSNSVDIHPNSLISLQILN